MGGRGVGGFVLGSGLESGVEGQCFMKILVADLVIMQLDAL